MDDSSFDLVAVGTGFATAFFLHRFLAKSERPLRVLVLEAGSHFSHGEQLAKRTGEELPDSRTSMRNQFVNETPEKQWKFFTAFGGTSNRWFACTPRLLPQDFRLRSLYGVGADWPIDYDELEPYYCDAEDLMQISGDSDDSPYPRSRPYPQPAHRLSAPDKLLKKAFPDQFFSHPCARSPLPVPGQRPPCCNNGVCSLCPIDAKFTVLNGMAGVFADPRIRLLLGARVRRLEHRGGTVTGVEYERGGNVEVARCQLAVLGANALFNPHIMLRSGLEHPELGRGLCEQVSCSVMLELEGIDNFQGGTVSNGLGYMFYDGPHRSRKAAAMLQTENRPELRHVRGKWLQRLKVNFVFEEFRIPANRVSPSSADPEKPRATFVARSPQTQLGLDGVEEDVAKLAAVLPVSSYRIGEPWETDSHIMGTTVMGADPATSVVDRDCVHNQLRNLIVLGSGVFPTAAPANPTLTLSALALRAADRLAGRS